ncbi:MAG: ABC transporter permease [Acidaminococcaceae bacterium]|nr:ABC transporter permease [Acidaminococcaceae bacterium]MBQ9635719.1 ABC transporter permease [Acidaminococcaceae bacterium]MBQ9698122.1 ABC transporter permease [Acidaminococcaceae bacterium]MBR1591184.1 ABC transporter permease [Acidaminococcaceae bacterium]
MDFNILPWGDIIEALKTTFFMVSISLFIGTILAVILAFALVLTNDGGLWENRYVFYVLNSIISLVRSLPFIILMTFIFPFTKLIVGTRIGATAALVPLVCFIVPYLARLFENSLLGVDKGIIRAAKAMGADYFQIIWYFILPEAKSSMILSITIGTISLISATAQAGTIGAGGIGDMALTYGYERMDVPVMLATIVILVVIVQSVQTLGNYFAKRARNH